MLKRFFLALALLGSFASCSGRNFVPNAAPLAQQQRATSVGSPNTDFQVTGGVGRGVFQHVRQPEIRFASDRSILFDRVGENYQLSAVGSTTVSATYTSRNPRIATVTENGIVRAVSAGISVIDVRAGGLRSAVTVAVAQQGPNTVVIPSVDVLSANETNAVLRKSPQTRSLRDGEIVISGDRGGLFGRIVGLTESGGQIAVSLAPTSIPDAFPNMTAHVTGAPTHVRMTIRHSKITLRYDDGTTTVLPDEGFSCKGGAGIRIAGPSFTFDVTVSPKLDLVTRNAETKNFSLSLQLKSEGKGETGSVESTASGLTQFECKKPLGDISVPVFDFLALVFTFDGGVEIGVEGSVTATGTLAGPEFDASYTGEQGVDYTHREWTQVDNGTPSGSVTTSREPSSLKEAIHTTIQPFADVTFSVSVALFTKHAKLVKFSFFDLKPYVELDFMLSSPIDPIDSGYTGPSWDTNLGIEASFNPKIDGALGLILKYLKIPGISLEVTLWDPSPIPLAGSPTVTALASAEPESGSGGCTITLGASVEDDHTFPIDYSGDTATFEAISGPRSPFKAGSGIVIGDETGSSTSIKWHAPADGPYSVIAWLDGGILGSILPYASKPVDASCVPPGRLVLSPSKLTFTNAGVANSQSVAVSQSNYGGTFDETDACENIATLSASRNGGGKATYKATPVGAGSCNATFYGGDGKSANLPISVTLPSRSKTFSYNGTTGSDGSQQNFIVPDGVTMVTVAAAGSGGGGSGFGNGTLVTATISVMKPGETLAVFVGGIGAGSLPGNPAPGGPGGFNGGGNGGAGGFMAGCPPPYNLTQCSGGYPGIGGPGASDVREGGNTLANRVVVGGGGGFCWPNVTGPTGCAGNGGNECFDGILEPLGNGVPGGGATQAAGGAGGSGGAGQMIGSMEGAPGSSGSNGGFGYGGNGGSGGSSNLSAGAGGEGGAGGYYGGGGGGGSGGYCEGSGGGTSGGGSSFAKSSATNVIYAAAPNALIMGQVIISWVQSQTIQRKKTLPPIPRAWPSHSGPAEKKRLSDY